MHHCIGSAAFQALPELPASRFQRGRLPNEAVVYRGLAADWPAVRDWSFDGLAGRVPELQVQLVTGNREARATAFRTSGLRQYLRSLGTGRPNDTRPLYLKEFDLLRAVPDLRGELRHGELLPRAAVRSLRAWIGPAQAMTGLHYDLLDNLAVQVIGTKRWRLASPGAVERLGGLSTKYDAWAVLARDDARTLAGRDGSAGTFFETELRPGDVLNIPAGWWHEAKNLTPGLLFGGFHGPVVRVLPRWMWVTSRNVFHNAGWWKSGNCTCHQAPR